MSDFQQRHYVAIAEVIANARTAMSEPMEDADNIPEHGWEQYFVAMQQEGIYEVVLGLRKIFSDDNEKFDAGRFAAACVPEGK